MQHFDSLFQTIMEQYGLTRRKENQNREERVQKIKNYLQNRVMPILSPLQNAVLQQRPDNINKFCAQFLRQAKNSQMNGGELRDIQDDDIPEKLFKENMREKLKKRRKGSRQGVIGDRPKDGFLKGGQNYLSQPVNEHPQKIVVSLIMHLRKCMFFQHLQTDQLIKLVKRMKVVNFEAGDVIIREGQSGNELFIVDSGTLKCVKEGREEVLKFYSKGETFGELSLLYNNPRATTVTAIDNCTLFTLSRPYFSATLHLGMFQKFKECEELVERVDLFDSLNIYERTKLYQSMQLKTVGPQKYIIREGEQGSCFYIVAQGQLVAYKQKNGQNKLVYAYKKGDYFGEIALLRNLPRQASVKTISDVRLYFINAESFSRILGPLESILRRNQERYTRWASELDS